jgi:phosphoglycerol transferase MdoB-like AlkP superfamily enzyme
MNSKQKITLKIILFSTALLFFYRIVFYLLFKGAGEAASPADVLKAFFIGLRFDFRLALIGAIPFFLLTSIPSFYWQNTKKQIQCWAYFYTFVIMTVTLFYVGDIGYYSYLTTRINYRIFEFFTNVLISLQMVWQSYNVIGWLIFFIAATAAANIFFKKYVFAASADTRTKFSVKAAGKTLIFIAIFLLGIHSSFGQYPLRWSDAFFSQNSFISYLGLNPVHYLFDTASNSKKDFNTDLVKKYYPIVAPYLGVKNFDENMTHNKLNFQRDIELTPKITGRPNVVYIVMESMAAFKTGTFGNQIDSSPALDSLAKTGWLFRHFYTPTEGTARSMFCILSGIPDINAKSTSSRNPLIINQHTLINALSGYDKHYFIGGSATWGNIRGVYMNNVNGLTMHEGDNSNRPRTDVWGLSDLDLFRMAAENLSSMNPKKPFFALIQSASYHRPYTIPEDHGGYQQKTLSTEELKKNGFSSNEEYNSFRFSDYSLGEFFNLIKDKEFFKNTLFIIHGDHGLPHDDAANLTPGYKHFSLNRFHTPLVFYSPLLGPSQEFNNILTEPDVWPTILGILGMQYPNTALGRNTFATKNRYSFSYIYHSDPLQIMLYDDTYIIYGTEDGAFTLHKYNDANFEKDLKIEMPEKYQEMSQLLIGLFETSKYMLHNNPRITPSLKK